VGTSISRECKVALALIVSSIDDNCRGQAFDSAILSDWSFSLPISTPASNHSKCEKMEKALDIHQHPQGVPAAFMKLAESHQA